MIVPFTVADAVGNVTDPLGRVASVTNVTAVVAVLPAASAAVTVYVPGSLAPLVHVNTLDAYGPVAGIVTVSAAWVDQPGALETGKVAEAGPEPPSKTVATNPRLPGAVELKYTIDPLLDAPVAPLANDSDAVGTVLSTRTLLTVLDV